MPTHSSDRQIEPTKKAHHLWQRWLWFLNEVDPGVNPQARTESTPDMVVNFMRYHCEPSGTLIEVNGVKFECLGHKCSTAYNIKFQLSLRYDECYDDCIGRQMFTQLGNGSWIGAPTRSVQVNEYIKTLLKREPRSSQAKSKPKPVQSNSSTSPLQVNRLPSESLESESDAAPFTKTMNYSYLWDRWVQFLDEVRPGVDPLVQNEFIADTMLNFFKFNCEPLGTFIEENGVRKECLGLGRGTAVGIQIQIAGHYRAQYADCRNKLPYRQLESGKWVGSPSRAPQVSAYMKEVRLRETGDDTVPQKRRRLSQQESFESSEHVAKKVRSEQARESIELPEFMRKVSDPKPLTRSQISQDYAKPADLKIAYDNLQFFDKSSNMYGTAIRNYALKLLSFVCTLTLEEVLMVHRSDLLPSNFYDPIEIVLTVGSKVFQLQRNVADIHLCPVTIISMLCRYMNFSMNYKGPLFLSIDHKAGVGLKRLSQGELREASDISSEQLMVGGCRYYRDCKCWTIAKIADFIHWQQSTVRMCLE